VPISQGKGVNIRVIKSSAEDDKLTKCARIAPIGAIGELWLEGPTVGEGYLDDADRNARTFIENPPWLLEGTRDFHGRQGRLYRTGDLVCYQVDGSLEFVRRRDTQVKVRGQMVELGEVEYHVQLNLPRETRAGQEIQVAAEILQLPGSHNPALVAFLALGDTTAIPQQ